MNPLQTELNQKKQSLIQLEQQRDDAYQLLGKQTQEFVRSQSEGINKLVDEIIETKQRIYALEQEISQKEPTHSPDKA